MIIDEVVRSALSRAGVVRVKNALNPFLWAFAWSVVFLIAAYAFRDDSIAKYACLCLAALPLLVTMLVGTFFAFTQPDRLQSEEFILRQQELTMIERKGGHIMPRLPLETDNSNNDDDAAGPEISQR